MSLQVKTLNEKNLSEVYRFMKAGDFPDVPASYDEARPYFDNTFNFGVFDNQQKLKAGFVFGDITENSAFLDVVCNPNFKGRWATTGVLRQIYEIAFQKMGLDFIWVEPRNSEALKATLQAGFVFATSPQDRSYEKQEEGHVLILTKRNLHRRFKPKL